MADEKGGPIRPMPITTGDLNLLFELAPDPFVLVNEHGLLVDGNLAAEELSGYRREELLGQSLLESALLPDGERGKVAALVAAAVGRGAAGPEELELVRKDGARISVEVRARPMAYRGERVVLAIARDVTARTAAERALREAQDELEERVRRRTAELQQTVDTLQQEVADRTAAEQRLDAVIRQTADCIFLVDLESTRVVEANPALGELLGYAPDEVGRLTLYDFVDHPPSDIDEKIERIKADRRHTIGERRYRKRDGSGSIMLVSVSLITYGGRDVMCVVSRDVTQMRRLEQQLVWSQKMEAIGRMAGGLAHDLNNLMTVVSACCDGLALHGVNPQAESYLGDIRGAVTRGGALTRKLLALGRRQELQPRRVCLNGLIDELLPLARRAVGDEVTIDVQRGPDLEAVEVDPIQIEQVLLNLILNARDAMPGGGGRIALRTEVVQTGPDELPDVEPGRYARVSVSDDGVGMDAATLERVFEPFFSTKPEGQGTGLGLSVAFGIVRQHRGALTVQSRPGEGTTFRVDLPLAGR